MTLHLDRIGEFVAKFSHLSMQPNDAGKGAKSSPFSCYNSLYIDFFVGEFSLYIFRNVILSHHARNEVGWRSIWWVG